MCQPGHAVCAANELGECAAGRIPFQFRTHAYQGRKSLWSRVPDAPTGDSDETRISLTKILQIEFSPRLLPDREAILKGLGYQVISTLGSNARTIKVSDATIGVVVIGHGERVGARTTSDVFPSRVAWSSYHCTSPFCRASFQRRRFQLSSGQSSAMGKNGDRSSSES